MIGRAYALARAHGHEWATILTAEEVAACGTDVGRILTLVHQRQRELEHSSDGPGGIECPLVGPQGVDHVTCTGRTSWVVRWDGSVEVKRFEEGEGASTEPLATMGVESWGRYAHEGPGGKPMARISIHSAECSQVDLARLVECASAVGAVPHLDGYWHDWLGLVPPPGMLPALDSLDVAQREHGPAGSKPLQPGERVLSTGRGSIHGWYHRTSEPFLVDGSATVVRLDGWADALLDTGFTVSLDSVRRPEATAAEVA
jgi:hypothetical protein